MTYRGILHVHSTHSYDGTLSLAELKALLVEAGLSFACMTEHTDTLTPEAAAAFVDACRRASDEQFVFVPGFEVPYQTAHVLHIGAAHFHTPIATSPDDLAAWRRTTPLVVLAHPVRNRFAIDAALAGVIDGIEVWNQQYEGKAGPRPRSLTLLAAWRLKKDLIATGGIDLHRAEHLGSPYTSVSLEALTEANIVAALSAGRYTFGHDTVTVDARATYAVSAAAYVKSAAAVTVIAAGKRVNALLAACGLRLPKRLTRAIRGRV